MTAHPPSAQRYGETSNVELSLTAGAAGAGEAADFAPLETGWYVFVVYKYGYDDALDDAVYNFSVTLSTTAAEELPLPAQYALRQNAPNPFNPLTAVRYEVPAPGGRVRIEIYDLTGHRVRTLLDATRPAGYHEVVWDGRNDGGEPQGSGVYFYRLRAAGFERTEKMMLLK